MYPAVRHDDDCPIRVQRVKVRPGSKAGGGLWWQKCVINVTFHRFCGKNAQCGPRSGSLLSRIEVIRAELGWLFGFLRLTAVSVVCSLLFLFTGRHQKIEKSLKNHPDPPRNHTEWIKIHKGQDKASISFIFYFQLIGVPVGFLLCLQCRHQLLGQHTGPSWIVCYHLVRVEFRLAK